MRRSDDEADNDMADLMPNGCPACDDPLEAGHWHLASHRPVGWLTRRGETGPI